MNFMFISQSGGKWGIGNTMNLSSVLNRLKYRVNEAKRNVVIIDKTFVSPLVVREYQLGAKVALFNQINEFTNLQADIAVNAETKGFQNEVRRHGGNVRFLGPTYLFLREGFVLVSAALSGSTFTPRSVNRVGLMLGGTDPLGLTPQIEDELRHLEIVRVAGMTEEQVIQTMRGVDLMMTGCGLGFWESLAVGTPAIPFAAHQDHIDYYSPTFNLGQVGRLKEMIANEEYTMPDPKWKIGLGVAEVIEEILK